MAVIYLDHFSGGSGLTATAGNSVRASLSECLRDVATDLAALQTAEIESTSAAQSAVSAAVVTAVADANDAATASALANDLKTKYNAAVSLINDLKTKYNAAVTLINEMKTAINAAGSGVTLLTTQG